jgi:hypothetical protein
VLDKFWEGVGGKLADRWAAVAVPSLIFWLGGLLAYMRGHGGANSLVPPTEELQTVPVPLQIAMLLVVLSLVAASGIIVRRLVPPVLRVLQGYWPLWLDPVRKVLVRRVDRRVDRQDRSWQHLAPVVLNTPTPDSQAVRRFQQIEHRRRHRPSRSTSLMPTRLGNVLAAAESRPADKYGLSAIAVWPHLWLVLPDDARREIVGARAALDAAAASCIWGAAFIFFSIWTPLAAPVGLLVVLAAYLLWLPARAETFADLVEAAFDLHRVALYRQLRWPLPSDPQAERVEGVKLTRYLWRGSDEATPTFVPPP